jgi:hypothetical protein
MTQAELLIGDGRLLQQRLLFRVGLGPGIPHEASGFGPGVPGHPGELVDLSLQSVQAAQLGIASFRRGRGPVALCLSKCGHDRWQAAARPNLRQVDAAQTSRRRL